MLTRVELTLHIELSEQDDQTVLDIAVRAHSPKKSFRRWENPTPRDESS